MGQNSAIEWTTHTFNPWIGCTKVSAGCAHCYAEELMDKRYGKVQWGAQGTRVRTAPANWRQPYKWDREAKEAGRRDRVFCASLADVFEDRPELVDWRRELFHMICCTPHLDWLLLTKRPENALPMMVEAGLYAVANPNLPRPQPNLWIGTSVEDQKAADERIPHLLRTPSAVRFLSMEPLLGPVDLIDTIGRSALRDLGIESSKAVVGLSGAPLIHWVIVGGESGHGARPMHPQWVRDIRDQCNAAGVAFFLKQWGEWQTVYDRDREDPDWRQCGEVVHRTPKGRWMNITGGEGFHNDHVVRIDRVGKKAAGRMLDGREWSEFPGPTLADVFEDIDRRKGANSCL